MANPVKAVVATEIGGTKLQVALCTREGNLISVIKGTAPSEKGAPAILDWFAEKIPEVIHNAEKNGYMVNAIGVGFGGPVESRTGKALVSHQVAGWENIPLKEWFEHQFGLPTIVANDANAAGWGEYRKGAGRGTQNFFYTNIGSGIGGALIIEGKLYDGQGFGAGEMGHTYIPDWTADKAGVANKVENLCSGWSIERRIRARKDISIGSPLWTLCNGEINRITCAMLSEAAKQGDKIAIEEIRRVAEGVGTAISNVITLFHPERIAVGGGVALMGEVLLEPLRQHVDKIVFRPYRNKYEIVECELGESVVLVGAALLAAEIL